MLVSSKSSATRKHLKNGRDHRPFTSFTNFLRMNSSGDVGLARGGDETSGIPRPPESNVLSFLEVKLRCSPPVLLSTTKLGVSHPRVFCAGSCGKIKVSSYTLEPHRILFIFRLTDENVAQFYVPILPEYAYSDIENFYRHVFGSYRSLEAQRSTILGLHTACFCWFYL